MKRPEWIGALLLLAHCAAPLEPAATSLNAGPEPASFCRIGPDDGPPLADGKTRDRDVLTAGGGDRGIGGTGLMATGEDRGIGGTGIIGVVTGFASVCVNGLEVGYAADVPVSVEGRSATPSALRAGQVVAVEAEGDMALRARHVQVRFEVSGPVEGTAAGGILRIAGQEVVLGEDARGIPSPKPGDWLEVSGLRRADGAIVATRLDPRPPGVVRLRGAVTRGDDGVLRIGRMPLRGAVTSGSRPGEDLMVTGVLGDGGLLVQEAQPDPVLRDPTAAFGPGVRRYVVESFVGVVSSGFLLGSGPQVFYRGPVRASGQRSVVELRRDGRGGLIATDLRAVGPSGAAARPGWPGATVPPGGRASVGGARPAATAGGAASQPGTGRTTGGAGNSQARGEGWEPAPVPGRLLDGGLSGPGGAGFIPSPRDRSFPAGVRQDGPVPDNRFGGSGLGGPDGGGGPRGR